MNSHIRSLVYIVKCFIKDIVNTRCTHRLPYPVSVKSRKIKAEQKLDRGTKTFDTSGAFEINRARLEHLESLELPIEGKRVLDVGCGVGHLAQFFVNKGCEVVCVDGRQENINKLHQLYPELEAHVINVETDQLIQFGKFDIVFAYGLLYHLENPLLALRNIASVCSELLLLETCICDNVLPVLRIIDESTGFSQALKGLGCRPSPSFVVLALNRVGFLFVYAPKETPKHKDFWFEWENNLDYYRIHNLRCVFVSSRNKLKNSHLVDLLRY